MEQFSLEKYLENPSRKVVTREGRPVRIVCWDSPNKGFPIVGFIDDNPTVFVWDKYGYALSGHRESNRDLFFADEKEELTEFEKRFMGLIRFWMSGNTNPEENLVQSRFDAKELLDLARKEIEKDNVIIDKDRYLKICDQYYNNGKKNALKDLPKWKKSTKTKNFDNHVILFEDKDRAVLTTEIYEDEYYIELDDLKTLPKEE